MRCAYIHEVFHLLLVRAQNTSQRTEHITVLSHYKSSCNQHLAGVGGLAGVDPLVIHVERFREKVNSRLKILQAHCTLYLSCVLGLVHLHLAALLVVAEGAGELSVQCLNVLFPGFWLTLGLSSSHYEIFGLFLEEEKNN